MTSADHGPVRIAPRDEVGEPGLRDYVGVLSRRRRAMVVFVLVVVGVALGSSLVQAPRYSATARVLIEPRASDQELDQAGQPLLFDRKRIIDTEVRLLSSSTVRDRVEETFGPDTPPATVAAVEGTDLIGITVSSTDPELAAAVANETARQYISFRTESAKTDLAGAAKSVEDQLADARGRVALYDEALANAEGPALAAAQLDRAAVAQQVTEFENQLASLQLRQSLTTGDATLVDEATRPNESASPQPVRSVILAAFAGSVLAVALAFVVEFFDDRVDTRAALEQVLPRLPVLGMVPVLGRRAEREAVAALIDRDSATTEAYRRLRTSLQFIAGGRDAHVILVTSAMPGEGKTTTAVNLAVMFALNGQRTILIDADLRRPRVHSLLGFDNEAGFSTAAQQQLRVGEVSKRALDDHPLLVIPAGPPTAYPAELIQSEAGASLINACRRTADVVIIDSPPVVPVADSVVLSTQVDAVALVVSAERSTKRNVRHAVELLSQVSANVCGTVLNEVPASQLNEYGSYTYQPDAARRGLARFFRPQTAS